MYILRTERDGTITSSTQHNFKTFKNNLYSGNENPELKIMHSGKVDSEKVIVFWI